MYIEVTNVCTYIVDEIDYCEYVITAGDFEQMYYEFIRIKFDTIESNVLWI